MAYLIDCMQSWQQVARPSIYCLLHSIRNFVFQLLKQFSNSASITKCFRSEAFSFNSASERHRQVRFQPEQDDRTHYQIFSCISSYLARHPTVTFAVCGEVQRAYPKAFVNNLLSTVNASISKNKSQRQICQTIIFRDNSSQIVLVIIVQQFISYSASSSSSC